MTTPPLQRPPVHRREAPRGAVRVQPRPAPRAGTRHRARRRTAWERASSASGTDVLAGLVLVMAAMAWLITFYFVLTFVW